MSLKLISGMMKSSGEEALLVMDAGGTNQLVVIDRQALRQQSIAPAFVAPLDRTPSRPHQEQDALVPKLDQMVGRKPCARAIARGDAR